MAEEKKGLRIVVKVGSNVLTRPDGKPNVTNMSALVDQIAVLRAQGHEVILVSSGAVACGRGALRPSRQLGGSASVVFIHRSDTPHQHLQFAFQRVRLCRGSGADSEGKFLVAHILSQPAGLYADHA